MKVRKAIPYKLKASLQKEIKSTCPFCGDQDVGYFEFHHIDEDPSNNAFENLLMLCANCHSKITKGDISLEEVLKKKRNLPLFTEVKLATIRIDSENCAWEPHPEKENAFFEVDNGKSRLQIFDFTFINHSSNTVTFNSAKLSVKSLSSGLSGLPRPATVDSLHTYHWRARFFNEWANFYPNPILQVPSEQALRFKVVLSNNNYMDGKDHPFDKRTVMYFVFNFSDDIVVKAPPVFINCKSKDEPTMLWYAG